MVQLTPQTVNRLCEYFLYLANLETEIEIIRNMLCEFDRFHPFPLFKYIDGIVTDSKGKLTPADILQFMEDNGFVHNLQECTEYIDLYDDESKGVLLYSQFLRTCLPQNNINLRQKIVLSDIEKLPLEENIAYTLAKMINHEIRAMQTTSALIQQLEDCSDYSPTACFQYLDTKKTEKILSTNFKELFTKSAIVIYPEEVQALFRRFDLLSDGVVDKIEFLKHFKKRVFNPRECKTPIKEKSYLQTFQEKSSTKTPKKKCQTSSTPAKKLNSILKNGGSSPRKEFDNPRSVSFISSSKSKINPNLNTSYIFKTPSSQNKKYIDQKTELRAQMQLFKVQRSKQTQNISTVKKPPASKSSGKSNQNLFKPHEFICNTLIEIMNLEKDIEKQKIELCLFSQFSICDVFRELDKKQSGFLTVDDLEKFSKRQNLQQIFKRLAPDGRLRFNQFINLIEPISTFYQEQLHKQQSAYPNQFSFSNQQKKLFQQLLELISKREVFLEQINMKINYSKQYDLKYLFMLVDESSNDNMISLKDLDAFLFKQQKQPELEDIELLFNWLDTDKDGKISFPDFINIFAF